MKKGVVVKIPDKEARLRRKIRRHFKNMGFTKDANGLLVPPGSDKQSYRDMHAPQRANKLIVNKEWIDLHSKNLIQHFANGSELKVEKIRPHLEVVRANTWQSNLFRLATYYWRIPISEGYGRRMRFLVWDKTHKKLMGIFALGDAVFNLKARDEFIGWDHHQRARSLVNLMDAYALGAVPPYNQLLGGKVVASLIQTREVMQAFEDKYKDSVGIISGESKNARLVGVTTTSALGRSSIYNRLQLGGKTIFKPIGYSSGWGHFHISNDLFEDLRNYLEAEGDAYANSHSYGQGPNFRLRVIRKAFASLGINQNHARHGLTREIFFSPLATNALQVLRGKHAKARYGGLQTVFSRGKASISRWMIPRSKRMSEFRNWTQEDFIKEIMSDGDALTLENKKKVS